MKPLKWVERRSVPLVRMVIHGLFTQRLDVHGRDGESCHRCGHTITKNDDCLSGRLTFVQIVRKEKESEGKHDPLWNIGSGKHRASVCEKCPVEPECHNRDGCQFQSGKRGSFLSEIWNQALHTRLYATDGSSGYRCGVYRGAAWTACGFS